MQGSGFAFDTKAVIAGPVDCHTLQRKPRSVVTRSILGFNKQVSCPGPCTRLLIAILPDLSLLAVLLNFDKLNM